MRDILEFALEAHGGADLWRRTNILRVKASIGGELWGRRKQEGILRNANIVLNTHKQRLVFEEFTAPDRRGVFEPGRNWIETDTGGIVQERHDPARAFAGQTPDSPWDDLNVVYAAGYGLWCYLTAPFILLMPGVTTQEIDPREEAGEEWRRLQVVFPSGFVTHAPEQIFSFNSKGLLRRQDYHAKVGGVAASVNYAAEHKNFSGLILPSRRRIVPRGPDGRSLDTPVFMTIDIEEVSVID
jgi:hypothetical protein